MIPTSGNTSHRLISRIHRIKAIEAIHPEIYSKGDIHLGPPCLLHGCSHLEASASVETFATVCWGPRRGLDTDPMVKLRARCEQRKKGA